MGDYGAGGGDAIKNPWFVERFRKLLKKVLPKREGFCYGLWPEPRVMKFAIDMLAIPGVVAGSVRYDSMTGRG
jgi:hypothetical protein